MNIDSLIDLIKNTPEAVQFTDVIDTISQHYEYTPTEFSNGHIVNDAGSNEGSCKIFAFALLNELNQEQTLNCFGHYYRDDVLGSPDGSDHANIRQFMLTGWTAIKFNSKPLKPLA